VTHVKRPLVVTFGEMLLRLSPGDGPRLFESEQLRAGFGGAEANVAVSLAHFDIWCEYVTRLPANLIGDAAIATLRAEGVRVNRVLRGPERMGLYFVEPGADVGNSHVVYDRAASAFAAMTPSSLDWSTVFGGVAWFHATGITAALGPGPVATLSGAIAAARARGVPVSIDLNYRPALWHDRDPVPIVAPLIHGVDLLIANPHSARAMLGLDVADDAVATPDGARALAKRIADEVGCRRVALTRREVLGSSANRWSASLFDGTTDEIFVSRPWTVTVVDRIGGGDAFAAALIAALLQGRDPRDVLEFAVAASALKLRVPGDFNRVRTADVDQLLRGMEAAGAHAGELRG
jgi:2-dehydro-3-deoxygluconokinase